MNVRNADDHMDIILSHGEARALLDEIGDLRRGSGTVKLSQLFRALSLSFEITTTSGRGRPPKVPGDGREAVGGAPRRNASALRLAKP